MNNRGFSLMELLTVIALIGILSALGTFGFAQYSRKSQMTNQTRLLYGDLMEYRIKSMYEKRHWTFKMSETGYGIYSSALITVAPVSTVIFKHPVTINTVKIEFDSQGLVPLADIGTVCVASANDAVVDSVVISRTRVEIGKKKGGMPCAAANVVAK